MKYATTTKIYRFVIGSKLNKLVYIFKFSTPKGVFQKSFAFSLFFMAYGKFKESLYSS